MKKNTMITLRNETKKKHKTYKITSVMGLSWNWIGFWIYNSWKKAAMLCTASEEVIDKHYLNQLNQLGSDEKELKKN